MPADIDVAGLREMQRKTAFLNVLILRILPSSTTAVSIYEGSLQRMSNGIVLPMEYDRLSGITELSNKAGDLDGRTQ